VHVLHRQGLDLLEHRRACHRRTNTPQFRRLNIPQFDE